MATIQCAASGQHVDAEREKATWMARRKPVRRSGDSWLSTRGAASWSASGKKHAHNHGGGADTSGNSSAHVTS